MTKVEFRQNWWRHICNGKERWIHKQYMFCDKCGFRNGSAKIVKGMRTL